MTQNKMIPDLDDAAGETGKPLNARRCPTIAKLKKLISLKLATLVQRLDSFRAGDVYVQLGRTTISVRIVNPLTSPQERQTLAIATAQYIVHCLTTDKLPRLVENRKSTATHESSCADDIRRGFTRDQPEIEDRADTGAKKMELLT